MSSFSQVIKVNHSAKNMYDLVMDIEKYSEFLPWCKKAQIVEKISDNNLHADLLINFKNIYETYRSDVKFGTLNNKDYFVDVIAISGPFRKLINKWRFIALDKDNCRVEFDVEFEFNSKILTTMIGFIFKEASRKMVKAFGDRAQEIYK